MIPSGHITELKDNEIFVFGSNESGRHGRGAAKTAMKWGAKYGQAEGLHGKTYAIPTKNASITKALSLNKIEIYVNTFIKFAKSRQDFIFLVTEIGCGLAGYKPKDIAPLFKDALCLNNIRLPISFIKILKKE